MAAADKSGPLPTGAPVPAKAAGQAIATAPLLRFDDSELATIHATHEGLLLRFSAAQVVAGHAATAQVRFVRGVTLLLSGWRGATPSADCFGRLHGGALWQRGRRVQPLPLPWHGRGVRLELDFANGARLDLLADAAGLRVAEGAPSVDDYRC